MNFKALFGRRHSMECRVINEIGIVEERMLLAIRKLGERMITAEQLTPIKAALEAAGPRLDAVDQAVTGIAGDIKAQSDLIAQLQSQIAGMGNPQLDQLVSDIGGLATTVTGRIDALASTATALDAETPAPQS